MRCGQFQHNIAEFLGSFGFIWVKVSLTDAQLNFAALHFTLLRLSLSMQLVFIQHAAFILCFGTEGEVADDNFALQRSLISLEFMLNMASVFQLVDEGGVPILDGSILFWLVEVSAFFNTHIGCP